MVKTMFYFIFMPIATYLIIPGCHSPNDASNARMADVCQIHLQSWFSNTPVIVSVDNHRIFSDTISTGYIIARAALIPVQVIHGSHKLNVIANGTDSKDTTFSITDTLYIGVTYDSASSKIDYSFTRSGFRYD